MLRSQPTMELPFLTLSRSAFWGGLGCLLGVYVVATRIRDWRRLCHIPGPGAAGWTDFWLIRKTWQGKVFEGLGDVCKEYGEYLTY